MEKRQGAVDVVMVGVKRGGGSGRELLTWALAKFTKPGDRLIALHIASATATTVGNQLPIVSPADDDVFKSVTGIYDGFCSAKNIDLQFRISSGRSARKALVKEAKSCAAIRLILGASDEQPPSSFSLARYCSTHLPLTCSVLVIHHGKVVYEKPGDRRKGLGDEACPKGGKPLWISRGASGRQTRPSIASIKACREAASCWRLFCVSTDILEPYVYITPQLRVWKSRPKSFGSLQPLCAHSLLGALCLQHKKKKSHENPFCYGVHTRPITNPRIEESHSLLNENLCDRKSKLIGWPLLHHSISMPSSGKSYHPPPTNKMSVIEWVLQLPERPKPLLLPQSVTHFSDSLQKAAKGTRAPPAVCNTGKPRRQDCWVALKAMSCREFGFTDLQRATDNFSTDRIIGNGGCSHVYRGTLADGRVVAVKSFHSTFDAEKAFFTELEISRCLEHPHVIQLLGYCIRHKYHLLVYNLAAEGNLEQKLHGEQSIVLPWHIRYHAAVGVAKALAYLHNSSRPVIHRDVKSSNVVLLSDLTPQLIDFGLSIWAPTASTHITCNDVLGTFGYLAPEYFMYGKVNEKTDVYAFGVVLLELISGKHPLKGGISQENLVTWAKPFLKDESRFAQIVDPKLNGEYNAHQLQRMVSASALCLRQSHQLRPPMAKILQLLKDGCIDLEECKSLDEGGDSLPIFNDSDLHSHLTVALCGLDDDTSNDESMDFTNSKAFIEEYLQQRQSHPQQC